jgi:hypothetical protein
MDPLELSSRTTTCHTSLLVIHPRNSRKQQKHPINPLEDQRSDALGQGIFNIFKPKLGTSLLRLVLCSSHRIMGESGLPGMLRQLWIKVRVTLRWYAGSFISVSARLFRLGSRRNSGLSNRARMDVKPSDSY